ncbi:MAG: hypothetical protein U0L12_08215 [Ruminococcus sp.]|nr:hypothetical protein [Ruminococcus sp.]
MKNLFFVPFAFDNSKMTGINISHNAFTTYLQNLTVSLISAKRATPNIDVALVSNMAIPKEYEQLLSENGILIFIEPFDSFVFDNNYLWCLAFYKLCALEKVVFNYDYDNYIYTDADVFVQKSLDKVFLELRDNILLYDINHSLFIKDYTIIVDEFNKFGINSYITHYGGEFFGASRENAIKFVTQCKIIYNKMLSEKFITTKGDEFILSIAAYKMKDIIKNAGGYIYRFWTGSFYLVSTCYKYNEVAILHLPDQKQKGMIKIYNTLVKTNRFPTKEKIYRICGLKRQPIKSRVKNIIKTLTHK